MRIGKNFSKLILSTSIIGIGVFLMPSQSYGATTSTNMQVSVTVVGACTVNANNFVFPNYQSGAVAALDSAQQTITVTCPLNQNYTTALSKGSGLSYNNRRMSNAANNLSYQLFRDAGYSQVWGDGTGGTQTLAGIGSGAGQQLMVYGRITAGQNVPTGVNYTDTITVTVTY